MNNQSQTGIKGTYQSFKRQGSLIIRDRLNYLTNLSLNATSSTENKNNGKNPPKKMTLIESQRNIGSVTFFLEPKFFMENTKSKTFITDDMWLPIRDLTIAPNPKLSVRMS